MRYLSIKPLSLGKIYIHVHTYIHIYVQLTLVTYIPPAVGNTCTQTANVSYTRIFDFEDGLVL